jgi:hypothetical protein
MEILKQAARLVGFKNRQYETLTEITSGLWKIRIWRQAKSIEAADAFDHDKFKGLMRQIATTQPRSSWTASLMKLPHVACVAIVDQNGDGVSAYPDWG